MPVAPPGRRAPLATRVATGIAGVAVCLASAAAACSRPPHAGDSAPTATTGAAGVPPIELADNFEATTWKLDAHTIDSAAVVGDTLSLRVRYAGGCGTHRFSLAASRAFRESYPVQVSAVLTHDAGGDACRALLTETLRYDLTPLRQAYRAAYQTSTGSIVLHLWHQDRTLRYDF